MNTSPAQVENHVDEEVNKLVRNASEHLSPFHREVMDLVIEEIKSCARPVCKQ